MALFTPSLISCGSVCRSVFTLSARADLTNPFTILESLDQEIGKFYVVQERRATNFEDPKLWKGLSGSFNSEGHKVNVRRSPREMQFCLFSFSAIMVNQLLFAPVRNTHLGCGVTWTSKQGEPSRWVTIVGWIIILPHPISWLVRMVG